MKKINNIFLICIIIVEFLTLQIFAYSSWEKWHFRDFVQIYLNIAIIATILSLCSKRQNVSFRILSCLAVIGQFMFGFLFIYIMFGVWYDLNSTLYVYLRDYIEVACLAIILGCLAVSSFFIALKLFKMKIVTPRL